jgi:hypothetical protein
MLINLDGEKPDNVSQEQWDRLKNVFDDIYADESEEPTMTDKKLTDNEIKKALECCYYQNNVIVRKINTVGEDNKIESISEITIADIVNLINRLQAENERLLTENHSLAIVQEGFKDMYKIAKAEAYKECIEKVKSEIYQQPHSKGMEETRERCRIMQILDNLLKELVGE